MKTCISCKTPHRYNMYAEVPPGSGKWSKKCNDCVVRDGDSKRRDRVIAPLPHIECIPIEFRKDAEDLQQFAKAEEIKQALARRDPTVTKLCENCGLEKSVFDFKKSPYSTSGVKHHCKVCCLFYSQSEAAKETLSKWMMLRRVSQEASPITTIHTRESRERELARLRSGSLNLSDSYIKKQLRQYFRSRGLPVPELTETLISAKRVEMYLLRKRKEINAKCRANTAENVSTC